MSEKKPDLPIVHLPWSHWEALTARLDALEAAVFKLGHHALHGLQQRDRPELSVLLAKVNGYVPAAAPPPPAAAPAPDVIERAWIEGAEATRSALAAVAEARGATKLAEAMRDFPLPPMGGV